MRGHFFLAFVVYAIVATILLITEVDVQSTVDDSASCESSTFDEAVNLIREDLKDVKNLILGSNQQQCSQTELSCSKQAIASSFICEYRIHVNTLSFDETWFVQRKTN